MKPIIGAARLNVRIPRLLQPTLNYPKSTCWRRFVAHKAHQPRVHVLGLGSIGTFAAHALAEIPPPSNPSITLLLHRASLIDTFVNNDRSIFLKTPEGSVVSHKGYQLEVLDGELWRRADPQGPIPRPDLDTDVRNDTIDHLIVSVKATQTVQALKPLKHRLDPSSHILLLQNGSGIIEELNREIFKDKRHRPNYIIGIISHGVALDRPFSVIHTGIAATSLGLVPRDAENITPTTATASQPYLLTALPLAVRMNATSYNFIDILKIQLEKLAVNAIANPICAIHDTQTKFLFTIPEKRRALVEEISTVICALPELRSASGVYERFSPQALQETVDKIFWQNAETTTSMVWDLRRGQKTEIDFINGYWCARGREVGVPTPINDELVHQIRKRQGDID